MNVKTSLSSWSTESLLTIQKKNIVNILNATKCRAKSLHIKFKKQWDKLELYFFIYNYLLFDDCQLVSTSGFRVRRKVFFQKEISDNW